MRLRNNIIFYYKKYWHNIRIFFSEPWVGCEKQIWIQSVKKIVILTLRAYETIYIIKYH
jgi:hypothetical protein